MPDGGGKGHFTSMAEMREAIADHEKRLGLVERDVIDLTDMVATVRRPKRRKRRNVPPKR
jgi:hypothetical protein